MLNDQVALRKSAEFPWGTMAWIILGVCLEGGGGSFVFHDSLLKSFVGHLWRINWSIRLVKERLQQRNRHCGGFKCWRPGRFDLSLYLGSDLQYYWGPTTSKRAKLNHANVYIFFVSACMFVKVWTIFSWTRTLLIYKMPNISILDLYVHTHT